MDNKFFRHFRKNLNRINLWALLVIAIVSGVICVFALRNNNSTAIELRDKVSQADKADGDVEGALRELRTFVYGHMNTNLASGPNAIKPPIQLKYRYDRLVAAEEKKAGAESAKIYTAAQKYCEKKFPVGLSGSGRIPCIKDYIADNSAKSKGATIPDSLYKFDFVSPMWSPDLAGWTLLLASLSLALFVIRFGMDRWVRAELRDL